MSSGAPTPAAPVEGAGLAGPAPEKSALDELGRAFKGTQAALRRLRGRETHAITEGISNAQYGLLFSLLEHQRLSSRELAEQAELTPATATQMLEALDGAGLVSRQRSEQDRRVVLTSLTEHGQQLCQARRARIDPLWRAALSEFSDAELRIAARVLDRLSAFFDSMRD